MHVRPMTWVNGLRCAELSVSDRGLQYGDGFFTTAVIACGQLLNWSAHWRRIRNSAERLDFPEISEALLMDETAKAFQALNVSSGLASQTWILKILITRGSGGRGYQPPLEPKLSRILQFSRSPEDFVCSEAAVTLPIQPSISIGVCRTRAAIQPQLAGIKHLNRLENVLARAELGAVPEGIMLNGDNDLVGGTQSNLFILKNGCLLTPELSKCGVEGTTRYQLMNLARTCFRGGREARLQLSDLAEADSVFLANAVRGIMPVRSLETATGVLRFANRELNDWQVAWQKFQSENGLDLLSVRKNSGQ
ncbi:aminodeoxychorismate lyase [Thiomicrorhabdus sp.]|uniref:aminodeoxychorismate lyase n=1 Tax=Thiomicrorhabdus sp. TaxID=2039724 RepID=UPI0029C753C4|nr:aminodeoxychorismate lyase [Thiomicrorhabdus sp.]